MFNSGPFLWVRVLLGWFNVFSVLGFGFCLYVFCFGLVCLFLCHYFLCSIYCIFRYLENFMYVFLLVILYHDFIFYLLLFSFYYFLEGRIIVVRVVFCILFFCSLCE